jgi:hypothetical protein
MSVRLCSIAQNPNFKECMFVWAFSLCARYSAQNLSKSNARGSMFVCLCWGP